LLNLILNNIVFLNEVMNGEEDFENEYSDWKKKNKCNMHLNNQISRRRSHLTYFQN
jgi:hypothetical protein